MIVGTRESKLAMRQTEMFIEALAASGQNVDTEIRGITSLGDIDLTSPLNSMGEIGAFVKELDEAILNHSIDVSVNSMKDIPIDLPKGITIGAVMSRDAPEDVIIPCSLESLRSGSIVGTSSKRRECALKEMRPDLEYRSLRGNIQTRMSKLDSGDYDAIILAKAGLDRMSIVRDMDVLDPIVFVPAPAQGAIAIECREDDIETLRILSKIDDRNTRKAVTLERSIMKKMGAGCSSPVGIYAVCKGDEASINAVSFIDPNAPVRFNKTASYAEIESMVPEIAEILGGIR